MANTYSIIIPHHNIPHLLRRCLSSIPKRDDIQVIVVDDRSDEQYLPVLRQVENDFLGIEFIYSPIGKGAGYARNAGLQHAKGNYVLFADADDFFTYCIGEVLDEYANCDYDAVFFNAHSLDTDTYATAYRSLHLNAMITNYQKHPETALFELRYAFGEPWCKMVKRALIEQHDIRFSETIIHNDTRYSYLIGYYSRNIKVDKRAIYCVTDRTGSVSKTISLERLMVRTAIFAEANQFFKTHRIRHFEERGLRPFLSFLLKGDFPHARQCVQIMKEYGMSSIFIWWHCLIFPLHIMSKIDITLKKSILKYL